MGRKKWWMAGAAGAVFWLAALGVGEAGPYAPFTGIIKNNTLYELSVPSYNSLGTLIVPPRGWIEYVVWDDHVDLIPYRDGRPIPWGCQKIKVKPKAYPFMCKNYDFVAEITAPAPRPAPVYRPKKKIKTKKRPKRC
uniref:Uncharacterized protein n=1 Tax=Desulfobacca acetoxidans TaxID=60893 RepID=A0A7V4G7E9_9BACT